MREEWIDASALLLIEGGTFISVGRKKRKCSPRCLNIFSMVGGGSEYSPSIADSQWYVNSVNRFNFAKAYVHSYMVSIITFKVQMLWEFQRAFLWFTKKNVVAERAIWTMYVCTTAYFIPVLAKGWQMPPPIRASTQFRLNVIFREICSCLI